jgi:hypothetical protein
MHPVHCPAPATGAGAGAAVRAGRLLPVPLPPRWVAPLCVFGRERENSGFGGWGTRQYDIYNNQQFYRGFAAFERSAALLPSRWGHWGGLRTPLLGGIGPACSLQQALLPPPPSSRPPGPPSGTLLRHPLRAEKPPSQPLAPSPQLLLLRCCCCGCCCCCCGCWRRESSMH